MWTRDLRVLLSAYGSHSRCIILFWTRECSDKYSSPRWGLHSAVFTTLMTSRRANTDNSVTHILPTQLPEITADVINSNYLIGSRRSSFFSSYIAYFQSPSLKWWHAEPGRFHALFYNCHYMHTILREEKISFVNCWVWRIEVFICEIFVWFSESVTLLRTRAFKTIFTRSFYPRFFVQHLNSIILLSRQLIITCILLSKNLKTKIFKTRILPVVKHGLLH